MEIQLQELIEQIKKDGVTAAEDKAAAIINGAEVQAARIISEAKSQADKMIADAKAETERTVKSGEDALRQAGRNLLISFRESVAKELTALVGKNVNAVYTSDDFASLIVHAVSNWAGKPEADDLAVILGSDDLAKMENTLLCALKAKLGEGVTLKANDRMDGGFRIAVNNGAVYYDYSAEAVTELLSAYLSPRVTALLKEAE
ncbi:MAG: V-type ATP synthase subunit E [Ruminococcaceae bacterium]|nr:V-type ATP synthase subunit E [Oscillospiraceae bacterium]